MQRLLRKECAREVLLARHYINIQKFRGLNKEILDLFSKVRELLIYLYVQIMSPEGTSIDEVLISRLCYRVPTNHKPLYLRGYLLLKVTAILSP